LEKLARQEIFKIKPYVPGKPVEEVERELGIQDVIKLASNENPLGPSPRAVEALRSAVGQVHFYPDGNCYYLKQALAAKLNHAPEEFMVGNGSDELLTLLLRLF
jgi:histidinol-phosphate aminotransferase